MKQANRPPFHLAIVVTVAWLASAPCAAQAQGKLPAPTRTVYKCTVAGKTVYTDEPCMGATKVDVEPTRGLDASSGQVRTGADVQRERRREQFAEAVRPLTGMDNKQFDTEVRRTPLSPEVKQRCRTLDADIATLEAREASAPSPTQPDMQQRLLALRREHRQLRC